MVALLYCCSGSLYTTMMESSQETNFLLSNSSSILGKTVSKTDTREFFWISFHTVMSTIPGWGCYSNFFLLKLHFLSGSIKEKPFKEVCLKRFAPQKIALTHFCCQTCSLGFHVKGLLNLKSKLALFLGSGNCQPLNNFDFSTDTFISISLVAASCSRSSISFENIFSFSMSWLNWVSSLQCSAFGGNH